MHFPYSITFELWPGPDILLIRQISALKGENVIDLLETVMLVAEVSKLLSDSHQFYPLTCWMILFSMQNFLSVFPVCCKVTTYLTACEVFPSNS